MGVLGRIERHHDNVRRELPPWSDQFWLKVLYESKLRGVAIHLLHVDDDLPGLATVQLFQCSPDLLVGLDDEPHEWPPHLRLQRVKKILTVMVRNQDSLEDRNDIVEIFHGIVPRISPTLNLVQRDFGDRFLLPVLFISPACALAYTRSTVVECCRFCPRTSRIPGRVLSAYSGHSIFRF